MRCNKIIDQLEVFLQQIVEVVLDEINEQNGTDYRMEQVWFNFKPEIMANAQENAQIELTEAQRKQAEINTLLGLADRLDDELLMELVAEQLDLDYQEIKSKLKNPDESIDDLTGAAAALEGGEPAGGGVVE